MAEPYNPYPPGLGNPQQASQATAAMRQEPWYNQLLQSWGLRNDTTGVNGGNPLDAQGNPAKLNDQQRATLMATAIQKGIGFNNKYDMVDENGQIAEEHHKLKKVAIAAAVAGLALTGAGLAGVGPLAGALGGAGAAGAGGAAAIPATEGIASATALGLPVTAGLGTAGAAAAAGGAGTALTTGAKLAGLFNTAGKLGGALSGGADPTARGNAYAAQENQLANNRAAQAKIDQGGPAADAQALRNALRASLIARMDPNAAPLSLNGHALPQLATPEGIASAAATRDALAARQAAGKSSTLFGIPDATQEELDARAKAEDAAGIGTGLNSRVSQIGDTLQTGARLANLGKGAWDTGRTIAGLF